MGLTPVAEDAEIITCWCGVSGTYDELFDDVGDAMCDGSGSLECECGGEHLCVCHNHGTIECSGCGNCEGDDEEFQ